jgi:hypothetical protein
MSPLSYSELELPFPHSTPVLSLPLPLSSAPSLCSLEILHNYQISIPLPYLSCFNSLMNLGNTESLAAEFPLRIGLSRNLFNKVDLSP